MATLNNELTRDLYHAGVSRHAFTSSLTWHAHTSTPATQSEKPSNA